MGSLLIIIKEKGAGNNIFGGFVYEPLEVKPRFYGCSDNFLFTINPNLRVYSTSRYNENFQYFNVGTKTLPNGFGMGGQYEYFGLWINSDFETGHSRAGPFCSTYNSPQLSHSEYFDIDEVEVFCVREIERDPNLLPPKRSAMDTNADAVAILEMANRKMYSKDLREPDLGLDSDEE
ncbi:TLD-domain-containing protein [Basidiobolus meristosporus CBS 931.73]|uniref:MTOR-associated protein MEAK7 n=1 Tax=Basidiobolus meristosporus CBS 931.73 TaxID=1314790 RepID=A0A1Y1YVZ6_9FUNG|nr:TLD-domain-containing protein [Basidiobolus meristosporus CBS 931.73]|eukprot:ORY02243.1 TLD-domain-containing protein [Basidiobolus meristosporus CBS 931.73]